MGSKQFIITEDTYVVLIFSYFPIFAKFPLGIQQIPVLVITPTLVIELQIIRIITICFPRILYTIRLVKNIER